MEPAAASPVHYDLRDRGADDLASSRRRRRTATRPTSPHPAARPRPAPARGRPDVGGGFGMKGFSYPEEILAVWAALHFRRDMRWIATRSEGIPVGGPRPRPDLARGGWALDAEGRFFWRWRRGSEAPVGGWSRDGPDARLHAGASCPRAILVPALGHRDRGGGRIPARRSASTARRAARGERFDGTVGRRGGRRRRGRTDRPAPRRTCCPRPTCRMTRRTGQNGSTAAIYAGRARCLRGGGRS